MNVWIPVRPVRLRLARASAWAVLLLVCVTPAVVHGQLTVEGLTGSAVSEKGPYYRDVQDAIKKFQARDIEGARAALEAAKEKTPKLAPPEVMLAQMFIATGQINQAHAELERAVKKWPDDPEPYALMGDLALGEGRSTEARQMYGKMLQVEKAYSAKNPNSKRVSPLKGRAYSAIGAVEEDRDNWDGAAEAYKRWIDIDPKSAAAHQRFARALFMAPGKIDPAKLEAIEKELKLTGELEPKAPPIGVSLANLYRQKKDTEKADEAMKKAISAFKQHDSLSGRNSVAVWFLQNGDFKQAKEHAEAALKLDPHSVDARLTLGVVARMAKDYATAEKILGEAHLLAPENYGVNNNMALVLIEKQDEASQKRAHEFAELNQRLNPNNPEALATLGWTDFRMNRLAEAERAFNVVMQANSWTADSAYFMAEVFKEQRQKTDLLIQLLTNTLDSTKTFAYRDKTQKLLDSLKERQSGAGKTSKAGDK